MDADEGPGREASRSGPARGPDPAPTRLHRPAHRSEKEGDPDGSSHPERGSATAEFAVVLPCIVLLLAVLLGAGACAATTVRAEEAARLSARSAARGDATDQAVLAGREVIGDRARIDVVRSGGNAQVVVLTPAPGIIGAWGGLEITARATARVEEGSGDDEAGP